MEESTTNTATMVKRKLGGFGLILENQSGTVAHVVKGGEAESVGIEVGDIITSVNEEEAAQLPPGDLVDAMAKVPVGKSSLVTFEKQVKDLQSSENGESRNKGMNMDTKDKVKESSPQSNGKDEKNGILHENGVSPAAADGEIQGNKYIRVKNWTSNKENFDTLHRNAEGSNCTRNSCKGSVMFPEVRPYGKMRPKEEVKKEAVKFLKNYYTSIKKNDTQEQNERIAAALKEIEESGTYELDVKELIYGAKTAWRNAARCIGRIQWNKLQLFDAREVTTAHGMFDAICKHIKYATNKGNLRSTITIFPQRRENMKDFRIWNAQLVRYAGYQLPDGTVIGDPASVKLTQMCEMMGWKGSGGKFDVLPLILQASGQEPELFHIPPDLVMEVEINHPKYDWFSELGLRWYCLPAVANMLLDIGGIDFPCTPFNGWYMASEIGARNFGDTYRYNMLQPVAKRLGLDTRTHTSLWKDKALVELNLAVLYSFNAAGATIMDHHSASESFMKHLDNEQKLRGGCPADWVWIVPPISGSACPVFHQEMAMYHLTPSFEYQEDPWKYFSLAKKQNSGKKRIGFKEVAKAVKLSAKLMGEAMAKRHKAIILYATETGRSENYAKILGELFSHAFDPKVMCMEDFNFPELEYEQLLLIVTSTFGNGEAPTNGEEFGEMLYKLKYPPSKQKRLSNIHIPQFGKEDKGDQAQRYANLRFSVFGLGSRAYPHFCAFAHSCRKLILGLGGEEIFPIGEGDELCGQEESFMGWAKDVFKAACDTFCVEADIPLTNAVERLTDSSTAWKEDKFKYEVDESGKEVDLFEGCSVVYNKKVFPLTVISKENLQHPDSSRSTILVRMMDTGGKQELAYEPGDHLAVFSENREELVNDLIGLLDNAPPADQPISLKIGKEISGPFGSTKKWESLKRFPEPCSLRQALTRYLDITSPPTPQLLLQLASQAKDQSEKIKLMELGKGSSTYEDWKFDRYPNIVEVLQEFPSLKVNFMLILTQLPLLQSRYYSISSSPLLYPGEVHVTVAVVNYRTQGGQGPLHHGVCSTWLNSLKPGDVVPCLIRSAPSFHLPEESSTPILMVGPGTGIAPFRSFWQTRLYQRNHGSNEDDLGTMELYFGCRNSNLDFIYKEELINMKEGGILDDFRVAFSREPGQPKIYVQDLLKNNAESVCELIMLHDGHIYVCGDVSMASDVCNTLQSILQEFAALSAVESTQFISKLRSSGRYHEDIFGVTLRTAEVTDRVRTAARKMSTYANASAKTGRKSSRKISLATRAATLSEESF